MLHAGLIHDTAKSDSSDALDWELCEAGGRYRHIGYLFQVSSLTSECPWYVITVMLVTGHAEIPVRGVSGGVGGTLQLWSDKYA